MAKELQIQATTGWTVYAILRNSVAQVWNGSSWVTYATVDLGNYDIPMSEEGTASGHFTADMPEGVAATTPGQPYIATAYRQLGGSPAEGDPVVGYGKIHVNLVDFTAADRTKLDTLHDTRLTADRASKLDNLDATISSRSTVTEAQVNAQCDTALVDYDGPTKAEFDAGLAALNDVSSAEVTAGCAAALSNYDGPTHAEMTSAIAGLNDLSQAEANAACDTALLDYDGPTNADLDAGLAALNDPTAATIADQVWNELVADHEGEGSTGEALATASEGGGGGTNVILGAITSIVNPGNRIGSPIALEMFTAETKAFALTVLDANEDAVDLSEMTLRFVVFDGSDPPVGKFQKNQADGDIVVSGDNNEVATVTVEATDTTAATPSPWKWLLWDLDSDAVLLHGSFVIYPAKKEVA